MSRPAPRPVQGSVQRPVQRAAQRPLGPSAQSAAPARPVTGRYVVATPAFTPAPVVAPASPLRRPMRHVPATSADARPVAVPSRQRAHARSQSASQSGVRQFPANLEWPKGFDDWMIDIMRRRALRLNSGARRRGAIGSVRAVELAHIVESSIDTDGQWICAICHKPMTLADLSFDHIVALADGGEHAAHNLAPTHRKCNEIKGSEKAQDRAKARDRWFNEWASGQTTIGAVARPQLSAAPITQSRYA